MRLISAGVRWIFDDAPQPQELEEGLYQLARIVAEHDRRLQRYRLLQRSFASLTMGEGQVLAMVLEGRHNNEIASSLEISIRTVESRRANLYRKWDVASLAALARLQFEFEALRQLFEPNSDSRSF